MAGDLVTSCGAKTQLLIGDEVLSVFHCNLPCVHKENQNSYHESYDEAEELAHVVVDAVLRLVADDLETYALDEDCDCQTDSNVTTCDCVRHLTVGGIRDAADRIRALLPSTLRIGNLSHGKQ